MSITLIAVCLQLDIPLCEVSDRCWLVDEFGKLVDFDTDSKLDFHFDAMLDQVAEWKKQAHQDSSLLGNSDYSVLFSYFISLVECECVGMRLLRLLLVSCASHDLCVNVCFHWMCVWGDDVSPD